MTKIGPLNLTLLIAVALQNHSVWYLEIWMNVVFLDIDIELLFDGSHVLLLWFIVVLLWSRFLGRTGELGNQI